MIDFIERVPIESVTGSEYNPRSITDEALEKLQYSIKRFGMVKPLIVNATNNVITAGHQRRKAAAAIGLKELPCIRINSPNLQDEILFNLMHNSIETSKTSVMSLMREVITIVRQIRFTYIASRRTCLFVLKSPNCCPGTANGEAL